MMRRFLLDEIFREPVRSSNNLEDTGVIVTLGRMLDRKEPLG
jgi:hypothetical protein